MLSVFQAPFWGAMLGSGVITALAVPWIEHRLSIRQARVEANLAETRPRTLDKIEYFYSKLCESRGLCDTYVADPHNLRKLVMLNASIANLVRDLETSSIYLPTRLREGLIAMAFKFQRLADAALDRLERNNSEEVVDPEVVREIHDYAAEWEFWAREELGTNERS